MEHYSDKKIARVAGLLYLIVVLTGIFSLAYVPSKIIDWDNPALTFQQITASSFLFKLSIVGSMVCYAAFTLLPIVLHELLKQVNAFYAKLMVVLAVVSVPISFLNLQHKFAVLSLIGKESYLQVFTPEQLQSEVMLSLNQYNDGISIASVFWGLWLFPFGYLVYKSGFLPKLLGVLLMAGCFGYLINIFGGTLFENYSSMVISKFAGLPATFGEIGTCLWLLIVGVRAQKG